MSQPGFQVADLLRFLKRTDPRLKVRAFKQLEEELLVVIMAQAVPAHYEELRG